MALAVPPEFGRSTPVVRSLDAGLLARLAFGLVLVVVAYRITFVTLWESMLLDTPLAHLSLVPLISIALAVSLRRRDAGPDIRDRQLDWIVGLPLVAAALFMNLYLPRELSWEFWVWRVDLLSLPVLVAGVVSLLFGVRSVWKFRTPILFLFLAWPYPYAAALDRWLGAFTNLTIDALGIVLQPVPLATRVARSESLFEVVHEGVPIRMSVASACSGANGLIGFLLVGTAFMFVVDGTRRRKLAWLATGALLVWAFNLVRIMSIFWTARRWGEEVAIDGFHPYVGLVVFNISVVVMMLLMSRFGLRFASRPGRRSTAGGDRAPTATSSRPRPVVAGLSLTLAAVALTAANGDLRAYDRVATSLGDPQLLSFAETLDTPAGWRVRETDRYDWSQRFFGDDSEWIRYSYSVDPGFAGERTLSATLPITADVISTSNRGSLSSYGVEQCYSFHGHDIDEVRDISLGNGLYGGMLTWTNTKKNLSWTTLYWHWPIRDGDSTRYERITLVMQQRAGGVFTAPSLDDDSPPLSGFAPAAASSSDGDEADDSLQRQQGFLVDFARELVALRE